MNQYLSLMELQKLCYGYTLFTLDAQINCNGFFCVLGRISRNVIFFWAYYLRTIDLQTGKRCVYYNSMWLISIISHRPKSLTNRFVRFT